MTDDGKLHGYNEMNNSQQETILAIKLHEENLAALIAGIDISDELPPDTRFDPDYTLLIEAKRHFMLGYMLLTRAVARPVDPYDEALENARGYNER